MHLFHITSLNMCLNLKFYPSLHTTKIAAKCNSIGEGRRRNSLAIFFAFIRSPLMILSSGGKPRGICKLQCDNFHFKREYEAKLSQVTYKRLHFVIYPLEYAESDRHAPGFQNIFCLKLWIEGHSIESTSKAA